MIALSLRLYDILFSIQKSMITSVNRSVYSKPPTNFLDNNSNRQLLN